MNTELFLEFNASAIVSAYLINVLIAATILIVFWLIFYFTKSPLERFLSKHGVDDYLSRVLVYSVLRTVWYVIGIVTALAQLGINVLAAMTGFGIAGIAVGFAAKDTLANVIAGFMIFWDKPFRVGDWVEIDNHYGEVQAMSLRSTRIHTMDNFHIVIPNQVIANTTFVNHHKKRQVRKKIYFYIPYDSDIDLAKRLLIQAGSEYPTVLEKPEPGCGISAFEGARIKLVLTVWCANALDAANTGSTIRQRGKELLDQNGFGVPYEYSISTPKAKRVSRKKS